MSVRRASEIRLPGSLVSVVAFALALGGCGGTGANDGTGTSGHVNLPTSGVAYLFGDSGTSTTKMLDVFDTANHTLLGRYSALVPSAHTHVGPIVLTPDGRSLFVTAYDTIDPSRTQSGLYEIDLATSAGHYVRSLGKGIPTDATLASGGQLDVLVADASSTNPREANRIVAIDTRSNALVVHQNPLPADANGLPVPISIVADPRRRLTYVTDVRGTIYALRATTLQFYRKLAGVSANFTANGASIALDPNRSLLYQLGIFTTSNDRQQLVTSGAMLSTSLVDGGTRLTSFPYTPVAGAALDRSGTALYFGSFFAPSPGVPFVSRIDLGTTQVRTRPIDASYGKPEFLNTGRLALSSDGAHVLVPVSTDTDSASGGAMLEFNPGDLTLQSSAPVADDFQSGGVVSN